MSKKTIEFEVTSGFGWLVGLLYYVALMFITGHQPTVDLFGDWMPVFILSTVVAFVVFVFTLGTKIEVVEIADRKASQQ